MTAKHWKLFAGAVIIAVILFVCWRVYTAWAISFFQNALRSEHIEVSASAAHSLRALELAYAQVLARRSPYLALAGVDPDRLGSAIQELADTQNGLAGLQKDPAQAAMVRSALYPVDFLRHAAATERARLAFMVSGSETDYDRYLKEQYDAVRAYEHGLASFKKTVEDLVPRNTKNYADSAYIINRDGIVNALDALQNGIEGTRAKIMQRERCVSGIIFACNVGELRFPILTIPQEKTIPASSLHNAEDISALITTAAQMAVGRKKTEETQLIALSYSACTDTMSDTPLFRLVGYTKSPGDTASLRPYFVGDIRFEKMSSGSQTNFHTFFTDRGVVYVPSNPLTHYTCLALDTDLAKIFATHNAAVFAHETLAGKTGVIQESDAVAYVVAAQHAAGAGTTSSSTLSMLESLSLQMQNNSAGFDDFVRGVARTELANINITKDGAPVTLTAPYLFYARSAFLGLFMNSNTSVVGALGSLLPPNTVPLNEQPFEFYSTMAHTPELRDAVIRDISAYFRLHMEARL